jgi:hypothetical protein
MLRSEEGGGGGGLISSLLRNKCAPLDILQRPWAVACKSALCCSLLPSIVLIQPVR